MSEQPKKAEQETRAGSTDANADGPAGKAGSSSMFPVLIVGLAAGGAAIGAVIATLMQGTPARGPIDPIDAQQVAAADESLQQEERLTGEDAEADEPAVGYGGFRVADFALTDQTGAAVTAGDLEGEVTLLNFFFASCPGPCPAMNATMAELGRELGDAGVRMLSISVDGDRDSVEVISNYARGFGADASRWQFATGPIADVEMMLDKSFGYGLRRLNEEQIEAVDGTEIANILHPTRILLVGPERQLLLRPIGYQDEAGLEELKAAARAAAEANG